MKHGNKRPFAGLPLTLAHEILKKSGQIANDIYVTFDEIRGNREKLRAKLQEQSIVQNDSITEGKETPTSCGIDGCFSVDKFLTSNIACCAAFAVEGLIPPSGKKHWESPSHNALFFTEKENAKTADILESIMMEMELELAANAPHEIIFLNGSFITPLICIMESLKYALELKESKVSREFISRMKATIISFNTILKSPDAQKIWVGIPGEATRKELIEQLQWPNHYDDSILFTILLSPGEFTTPVKVEQSELSRVRGLPIKDEKFAAMRDSLVSALCELHIVYYRPFEWTPVFRIEIARSVAEDTSRLALLLNVIKFQCCTAGIREPYPVYMADSMVKSMKEALPSLRSSVLTHITSEHSDDIGELFSLLIHKELLMGDYNGQ